MKKIKEINLNIDTSRYSSPYVKNRQRYYSGYTGGMTDSASSMTSTIDNSRIFKADDFEEESEEEDNLMPENILNLRVRSNQGKYSITETLKIINEVESPESIKILEKMEDVHKGLITDLIDATQSIVNILEIPGPGSIPTAAAEYIGGTGIQFLGGNIVGNASKLFAKTRSDVGSMTAVLSEMMPLIAALPMLSMGPLALTAPIVAGINKILLDAIECLGNLGTILDESDTTKNSLYSVNAVDVATELAGDAFPSAVDAADPTGVIDGIVGTGRLALNLGQLWSGTSKGERLIQEYLKLNPTILDKDRKDNQPTKPAESVSDIINRKFSSSSPAIQAAIPQKQSSIQQLGSNIPSPIKNAIDQAISGIKLNESYKLIDLFEGDEYSYYGIDEDQEDNERDDEDEIDEIGGYSLPLGATNKKPSEADDHIRLSEEIRKIQDWKLKTTGRIK